MLKIKTFVGVVLLWVVVGAPAENPKPRIAVVSPMALSLTEALTEQTGIEVIYLPPKRLPLNRIPSWIQKNSTQKFGHFDAFVTTRSINNRLDMFTTLRQSNIRLVEIDLATALIPKGERVAFSQPDEYYWLNSNNLSLMMGILNRDLSLLWPDKAEVIGKNHQKHAAEVRKINIAIDELLMSEDVAFVVTEKAHLYPLAASLASDVVSKQEAENLGMPFLRLVTKPNEGNQGEWVIDDFSRVIELPLIERLQLNHRALSEAISE